MSAASLLQYLPPHEGLLPKFLAVISVVSVLNSVQAYATLTYTKQVYEGTPSKTSSGSASAYPGQNSPATPLSSRTFGTWTFLSSVIRLYAAYYITNPQVYQLALWTYVIALGHFSLEWLVYGSARLGKGLAGPLVVASTGITWMLMQKDFYLQ